MRYKKRGIDLTRNIEICILRFLNGGGDGGRKESKRGLVCRGRGYSGTTWRESKEREACNGSEIAQHTVPHTYIYTPNTWQEFSFYLHIKIHI